VSSERSVLHVLPHPGGGGETYVDALAVMDGYRFERAYLASSSSPVGARASILRNALRVQRSARSFDLVHVVGEVAGALCLPALASRWSIFSPQGLSLLRRVDGVRRRAAAANVRAVVHAASRTICAAETERADVLAAAGRRKAARVLVIHNGVPLVEPPSAEHRAELRAALGVESARMVGAWIGTLDENKDPLTAIRAVERAGAEMTLLLVGDGPLRPHVEQAAAGVEPVRVLGYRNDVDGILGAADVFVICSRREGLSFSLLEAMSAGVTPVVSDAPANVEAIGDAGVVVPFGGIDAFAAAFTRLSDNPSERERLGRAARERIMQNFRVEQMIERTREVYEEVLRADRPR
jgi:glycosyltransferase involved in cell wall biosynthesis